MQQPFPLTGTMNPDGVLSGLLITYDGSGVPSVVKGRGIKSVVDDGAGLFTVTTDFHWIHLFGAGQMPYTGTAAGRSAHIVKDSIVPADREFQVRIMNDADAAEDPADGEGVFLLLLFQQAKLPVL